MASTPSAAAALALRFNAPIILGWSHRENDAHKFYFEAISPPNAPNMEQAKEMLTSKLNERLEAAISKRPEQWVWFHDRWKTQP